MRLDYYRQRRKTKLFQIENAINGNSENVFMSAGFNLHNVQALSQISQQKGSLDRSVDRLMEQLATKSQCLSPGLHQHITK